MRWALVGCLVAACGAGRPYRFSSPMLGRADVHPAKPVTKPAAEPVVAHFEPIAPIVAAPPPHGLPSPHLLAKAAPWPAVHRPEDLRALVGRRDQRDAVAVTLGWARALGLAASAASIADVVALPETPQPQPGDVLVFSRTDSESDDDLLAITIATDPRGVTEYVYLAGGVVRRGFLDRARPATRRDADGKVVNTYLRAGSRWPPKGTHYLAGELLAHVVRSR